MTSGAQSYYLSSNWPDPEYPGGSLELQSCLKFNDENNPDNYRDYFHKIDKIKVLDADLSY